MTAKEMHQEFKRRVAADAGVAEARAECAAHEAAAKHLLEAAHQADLAASAARERAGRLELEIMNTLIEHRRGNAQSSSPAPAPRPEAGVAR